MREATRKDLTDELRQTFATIADYLIPESNTMPAASAVDIAGSALDKVMDVRPDMIAALVRGLSNCVGLTGDKAANLLNGTDKEAFTAVSKAASGGYYMDANVRELLHYPGQENIQSKDPYASQSYVFDGSLKRVYERGPIYTPTPGQAVTSYPRLPAKDMK